MCARQMLLCAESSGQREPDLDHDNLKSSSHLSQVRKKMVKHKMTGILNVLTEFSCIFLN